jgi:hypothetical protein
MWSNIIIIYTIQKSYEKKYFDYFNYVTMKQTKILMHSLHMYPTKS